MGLALATGLWSGVQAINSEARASYDAAAATLGEGQFDQLVPRAGDRIPQSVYIDLRRAAWLVSPVLDVTYKGVRFVGIDPLTTPTQMSFSSDAGFSLEDTDLILGNAKVASVLEGFVDVTIDKSIPPGIAIADIGVVQRLFKRSDLSRLMILPEQPIRRPDLVEIAPELVVQPSQQIADVAALTDSFHLNLTAFGFLSFAVGLFIVHSTIGLAFEQRRGMIRTLRSLGVPLSNLLSLIIVEMGLLVLVGAVLGILMGYTIAALLLPDVAATVEGLYGARVSGTLSLRPEWWLSGIGLAFLGAGMALAVRIWQIMQMPLLSAVQPRETDWPIHPGQIEHLARLRRWLLRLGKRTHQRRRAVERGGSLRGSTVAFSRWEWTHGGVRLVDLGRRGHSTSRFDERYAVKKSRTQRAFTDSPYSRGEWC